MSTQWAEIIEILRRERLLSAAMLNSGASSEELAALEKHVGINAPHQSSPVSFGAQRAVE